MPVEKLEKLASRSSTLLEQPLNDATGVRNGRTNSSISGSLFAFVAVVWVLVAKRQGRARARDS